MAVKDILKELDALGDEKRRAHNARAGPVPATFTPTGRATTMRSSFIATTLVLCLRILAGCEHSSVNPDDGGVAGLAVEARVSDERPTVLQLVGANEPGDPLILEGRVLAPDGASPLPGARLDVYHTDAGGYYTRPVSRARNARIRGSVWTDEDGRYEIRTIMPGHYPSLNEAAHIHVHLATSETREFAQLPDHWIDSVVFADDPYLEEQTIEKNAGLGRFSAIVELEENDDGVLIGERDIRLDPDRAEENALVDGWYQGE